LPIVSKLSFNGHIVCKSLDRKEVFRILGYIAPDTTKMLPIKLPISALMAFCPLLAAVILTYRERKNHGVKELLKLSFDFRKIKDKRWFIPIILLTPAIAIISYGYMKLTGALFSESEMNLISVIIFFFIYFIGAIGEEVGWSGYAIDPLQNRYIALKASLILGVFWAIWHIIPWRQAHQTTTWIVWQGLGTIFLRVVMVWIFNNSGKSVFAMVLFHTMLNTSPYLTPNYGSTYNPFIFAVLLIIISIAITYLWGARTLARFRFIH
jgi:uncharacterized protein